MSLSEHVNLDRDVGPSISLAGREVVQPLEADDATFLILDQDDIVADLLADRLLGGIIEPDRDRIAGSIVINPDSVHGSCPHEARRSRPGGGLMSPPIGPRRGIRTARSLP